jgi:hypothetical protein
MLRNKKIIKVVSIILLLNMVNYIFAPSILMAGPVYISGMEQINQSTISTDDLVDLQSGDFKYNVPLLNVPGPDGNHPISISYKAGIKNEQDASWVGLGWDINPGAISRTINGHPDDFNDATVKNIDTWAGTANAELYTLWTPTSVLFPSYLGTFGASPNLADYPKYTPFYYYASASPGTSSTGTQFFGSLHGYGATLGNTTNRSMETTVLTDLESMSVIDYALMSDQNPEKMKGGSMLSYDNYFVSGPGLNGEIQPVVLNNGSMFKSSHTEYGTNYDYSILRTYCEDMKPQFRFKNDYSNSFVVSPTNMTTTTTNNTLSSGNNGLAYSYSGPDDMGFNSTTMKLAGSRDIAYFTNSEISAGTAKSKGFINYQGITGSRTNLSFITNAASPVTYNSDVSEQIGGYSITDSKGMTYHYALPAYTYGYTSIVNAPGTKISGRTSRTSTIDQAYSYIWHLTSITGPDFVDKNNNGFADEADYGGWTNFNYGKWTSNAISRVPYIGVKNSSDGSANYAGQFKEVYYLDATYTRSHTALFIKALRSDANGANDITTGGLGIYSENSLGLIGINLFKNEDLITLSALSTNSFSKDIFNAIAQIKNISTQQGVCSSKYQTIIDNADLINTSTGNPRYTAGNLLENIVLNYDYNLAEKALSSKITSANQQGKLTLNSIAFYGLNNTRTRPSIDFEYDLVTPKTKTNVQITFVPSDFNNDRHGRIDLGNTSNTFLPGDIIKMTISGITYYATLIRGINYYNAAPAPFDLYDVQFLGPNIPTASQKNIAVTATQTKNPPSTYNFIDLWGNFKSDYGFNYDDGAGYRNVPSGRDNFDRRTNSLSAQSVDVWSLKRIKTSSGATIDIQLESDSYSNKMSSSFKSRKAQPKGILNLNGNIGYTKTDGSNTFSTPVNVFNANTYNGTGTSNNFRFTFQESINYSEEFYVGQVVKLVSVVTFQQTSGTTNTSYPSSREGDDLFYIDSYGSNYISGHFILDPNGKTSGLGGTGTNLNPLWGNYSSYPSYVQMAHNGSYIIYEPTVKYGGGIRTKKITVTESAGKDYFETTYDYNSKDFYRSVSSGFTESEPLSFQALAPLNTSIGTDLIDITTPPPNPYYQCYGCPGNHFGICRDTYNAQLFFESFRTLLEYNLYKPFVMYEYVTRKKYGNGKQLPQFEEYHFQSYSDDMLSKSTLALSTAGDNASKTLRITDNTSMVGSILDSRVYDSNSDAFGNSVAILNERKYTYTNGANNQGLIEQIFHENRIAGTAHFGMITVKSDLPTILNSIVSNDYIKGQKQSITYNTHDFYSGQVVSSTTSDSYGNNLTNIISPAYHIFTSKPSSLSQMGTKAINVANRNMLTQPAANYVYKDISGFTTTNGTLSIASSYTASTTSGGNLAKYKMTLTSPGILSSRYTNNSNISINVTILGSSSTISPTIAYIYPDRSAFEFYYSDANLSTGSSSINSQNTTLIASSINSWNNSWSYRNYNSTLGLFENAIITDGTVTNPYMYQKIWRPGFTYKWNSPNLNNDGSIPSSGTGMYQEFDWSKELIGDPQISSAWQKDGFSTVADPYSNTIEIKDVNGNYVSSKMAYDYTYVGNSSYTFTYPGTGSTAPIYNNYILSSANNSNVASFCYSGFEELTNLVPTTSSSKQFVGELVGPSPNQFLQTPSIKAHTGNYMVKVDPAVNTSSAGFKAVKIASNTEGNIIVGKTYRASVWVHNTSSANAALKVNITGSSPTYSYSNSIAKSSATVHVGDWWLLSLDFDVPSTYNSGTSSDYVNVYCYVPSGSSVSYFDDFMVRPIDADMTSYVYDPLTKQITHTIDKNNFYVRNQYDNANVLVASFKETAGGEKQISSHKYNFGKANSIANVLPSTFTFPAQPFYGYYASSVADHYYSTSPVVPGGYVYELILCNLYSTAANGNLVPLYRYLNSSTGDHFYTRSSTTPSGYVSEGISGYVYASSGQDPNYTTVPLYRFWNSTYSDHYYSKSSTVPSGYVSEGVECYVLP